MNLSVSIGKLKLKNPVTIASGTFGYDKKYNSAQDVKKLGAFIPKTITLNAQEGNPPPRIAETPHGMINAIGIENPGASVFIRNKLPELHKLGVPLIVSISANSEEKFAKLACLLAETKRISAIELNLSCPNLKKKILVAQDSEATFNTVNAVKKQCPIPVIAKLSPNVTDISEIALAAQDAGADAVSMINTFSALAIDIKTRSSMLGNFSGGLSGPAIKPIGLNMVYRTAKRVRIPIIAMGGILNAEDALEYIIAGATMIAVGTTNFINPKAPLEILSGIKKYMEKNKITGIDKLIGSLKS